MFMYKAQIHIQYMKSVQGIYGNKISRRLDDRWGGGMSHKGLLGGIQGKKLGNTGLEQGSANVFCIRLDSKYFCICGHMVCVATVNRCH